MPARIWIINHYASTPDTGIGGRHHHFAQLLAQRGHQVSLIAAQDHHILRTPKLSRSKPWCETLWGDAAGGRYDFIRLPVPAYPHAHSKKRVLAWAVFTAQVWRYARRLVRHNGGKPDVILISSLSLVSYLAAERLARRYGARLVFEVRDIWPLTPVLLGQLSAKHPFVRFLQAIEDRAYRNSHTVISSLPQAYPHMKTRGLVSHKFHWIPNGVMRQRPTSSAPHIPAVAFIQALAQKHFVILYTGSMGEANALDTALAAMRLLPQNSAIHLVLIGDGRLKPQLKAQATDLPHVHFIDAVPQEQVSLVLQAGQACLLCWQDHSLYQFGISANKLAEYMLAGKPILHSYSGAADPVAEHDLGLSVPANRSDLLAQAMIELAALPQDQRTAMGQRAQALALERYCYETLVLDYEKILLDGVT